MMTFECELDFVAKRYVTLVAENGVVKIVGNAELDDTDREMIERYAKYHCERSGESFIRVDFDNRLTPENEEPGDVDSKMDPPEELERWDGMS